MGSPGDLTSCNPPTPWYKHPEGNGRMGSPGDLTSWPYGVLMLTVIGHLQITPTTKLAATINIA
eukprot:554752-Karenia_brevis.AAC.1